MTATWLNYHHLHYFWVTAREGNLTRAAAKLHLTPPGVSMQISQLEAALERKLFDRVGRRLVLTEHGRVAMRYADDIFGMGNDLLGALRADAHHPRVRLVVGVARSAPRLFALDLVRPALDESNEVVITQDTPAALVKALRAHELDVALLDAPSDPRGQPRLFNHLLGESDVAVFSSPKHAAALRRDFPRSLDGAPFIFPAADSTLAAGLRRWFEDVGITPLIVATVDDPALMKSLGDLGYGAFATHDAMTAAVIRQYQVERIGRTDIKERVYAVSLERRIRHPGVAALVRRGRGALAGPDKR